MVVRSTESGNQWNVLSSYSGRYYKIYSKLTIKWLKIFIWISAASYDAQASTETKKTDGEWKTEAVYAYSKTDGQDEVSSTIIPII